MIAARSKITIRRSGLTMDQGYPWLITCLPCWNDDSTRYQWRRRTYSEARLRAVQHARNRHGVIL